ncbi:MAG: hypothetical protein SXA11_07965 [Cyanobacteriota bacterium]|nr:hypothetical protein [Cyanobacteriota bacterium]
MSLPCKNNETKRDRVPARVLGCLRKNTITVIVLPGNGFVDGGFTREIPLEIVPFDLRMPNSEFYLLFDREKKNYIEVLRKSE